MISHTHIVFDIAKSAARAYGIPHGSVLVAMQNMANLQLAREADEYEYRAQVLRKHLARCVNPELVTKLWSLGACDKGLDMADDATSLFECGVNIRLGDAHKDGYMRHGYDAWSYAEWCYLQLSTDQYNEVVSGFLSVSERVLDARDNDHSYDY